MRLKVRVLPRQPLSYGRGEEKAKGAVDNPYGSQKAQDSRNGKDTDSKCHLVCPSMSGNFTVRENNFFPSNTMAYGIDGHLRAHHMSGNFT
jgi:hypothetical protein